MNVNQCIECDTVFLETDEACPICGSEKFETKDLAEAMGIDKNDSSYQYYADWIIDHEHI